MAHQAYYSLIGREFEWELMPLALDQEVGTVVWSPLGWGRLTGKIRRGQPLPETSRLKTKQTADAGPPVADDYLYKVVDALDAAAAETGKTVPQVALNWLLQRPTYFHVSSSARATKNSCVKTSAQSAGALRLSRSQSSMLPAPRPPSIRILAPAKASPSATLSRHHRVFLTATATLKG